MVRESVVVFAPVVNLRHRAKWRPESFLCRFVTVDFARTLFPAKKSSPAPDLVRLLCPLALVKAQLHPKIGRSNGEGSFSPAFFQKPIELLAKPK